MSEDEDNFGLGNGSLSGDENNNSDEGDTKRNEVRKEFTLEFEKKIAKYIPPKIKFDGDLRKKSLVTIIDFTKDFGQDVFISNLTLFNRFILLTVSSKLHFYDKTLKLIFTHKFFEDKKEEVLDLNPYNDETIVVGATDMIRVINFYEKTRNQITFEVIQEIKDTEFYALNEKLFNDYLLIGGFDRKYAFYEVEKKNEKLSKDNKFKLVNKIDLVHNVYDDDCPGIVDLNNGRLFSWLNDDKNIKVIDYYPEQKIIFSKNNIGLHNAGLISDKYLILMGLLYPIYYTWLMDTETLEIVHKWQTPQNDSFSISLSENRFIYGSESRLAFDEFSVENKEFKRKQIYEVYFNENKSESWEDSYGIREFLDSKTFITNDVRGKLMIYRCKESLK
jgi:hypothetical protein